MICLHVCLDSLRGDDTYQRGCVMVWFLVTAVLVGFGGAAFLQWDSKRVKTRMIGDMRFIRDVYPHGHQFYAWDFMKQWGWNPGRFYPAVDRMERLGWLESRLEVAPPEGRPARRVYSVVKR